MLQRYCLACAVLAFLGTASMLATPPATTRAQNSDNAIYLPLIIGGGRTVAAASTLQSTLDNAKPGDVIVLDDTTYAQNLTIRRSGTANAPITLRGAGIGRTVVKGKLRVQDAAYIVIQDLDIDTNGEDDAIRLSAPASYVTVQRVHLYGGDGYGVRVENDVTNVLIEDCEINDFDAGSKDAHGVGIMTASNVTVRGCTIHHNSGDGIQSNTPDYPGYGRFASTIVIEDNDLYENRENALDIKSTHGIDVRNNRMWGYRAVSSSDGMALQVQYDAQDVTITGNQIWDAVEGIEVSRGKKSGKEYPKAPARVTIANNLLRDFVKKGGDSASGSGIVVRTSDEVKIYNNTVLRADTAALYISYSDENVLPTAVDLRNNVLDGATHDLYFAATPAKFTGLVVDYNHYVNSLINGDPLADWLAQGYERHPTIGDPRLDDAFQPRDGSPLLGSGTDVGLPFEGSTPNRGWAR